MTAFRGFLSCAQSLKSQLKMVHRIEFHPCTSSCSLLHRVIVDGVTAERTLRSVARVRPCLDARPVEDAHLTALNLNDRPLRAVGQLRLADRTDRVVVRAVGRPRLLNGYFVKKVSTICRYGLAQLSVHLRCDCVQSSVVLRCDWV